MYSAAHTLNPNSLGLSRKLEMLLRVEGYDWTSAGGFMRMNEMCWKAGG